MSQNNRIFDDLGRLMNEAAGVADGVRREVETVVKGQAQRFVADPFGNGFDLIEFSGTGYDAVSR